MAGYIGSKASVVSSGAENKKVFTATAGQTSFTGLTYSPNRVHVFQNGVRLVDGTDYTATNGTSLTLTVGAAADDQVVVVSYSSFQTSDTVSASAGGTFSNAVTIDADGATVLTVDRATSDGTIIDLQKSGSSVGSMGNRDADDIFINTAGGTGSLSVGGTEYYAWSSGAIYPWTDNARNLGHSGGRFKDLYLSGGVYLGGTGSANKLEDYEEGTWNLTCTAFTATSSNAFYRVIGDVCYAWFNVVGVSNINSNAVRVNLPFTSSSSQGYGSAGSLFVNFNNISPTSCWVGNGASVVDFYNSVSSNAQYTQFAGGNIYGANASNFAMYAQFQYRIA